MTPNIDHCDGCNALLTDADDEQEVCTQCGHVLPPLRALLVKIACSCDESYVYSQESDLQAIQWFDLNLGDVRLARKLLEG